MGAAAFRAFFRHSASYNRDLATVITGIGRDTMTPPELTGNTPVVDIVQPVLINLAETIRDEVYFPVLLCFAGSGSHIRHFYKPLWFDHRLYGCLTSVVGSYVVNMIHYFYKKAKLLEILYHGFSCLVAVHAGVFAALVVHGSVIV